MVVPGRISWAKDTEEKQRLQWPPQVLKMTHRPQGRRLGSGVKPTGEAPGTAVETSAVTTSREMHSRSSIPGSHQSGSKKVHSDNHGPSAASLRLP